MAEVASRDLRNDTRGVLRRVEAGEEIVITVAGRPVAELRRLPNPGQWTPKAQFLDLLSGAQADPGLTDDLRQLIPEWTDDLDDPDDKDHDEIPGELE